MDNLSYHSLRIQKLLNLIFYQEHISHKVVLVLVGVIFHIGEMYCLGMVLLVLNGVILL